MTRPAGGPPTRHPPPSRRVLLQAGLAWALPCGGAAAQTPAPAAGSAPESDNTGWEWRPWPARRPTPALDLPALDGSGWRLSAQRGSVVLVNFWATWCAPCHEEMPSLLAQAARWRSRGLVLATVNYREPAPAIVRHLEKEQWAMTVLLDADGSAARACTPLIFPTTLVVARDGRAAGTVVGPLAWGGVAASALLAPWLAPR